MPTESRHCSHRKPDGTPCRAWAIRGSDPPTCASHARRARGGAPPGNTNAATHGFYSPVLRPDELADLVACADDLTLDDEIACARVIMRRLLGILTEFENGSRLDEIARLASLALQATRTIARLLTAQKTLGRGETLKQGGQTGPSTPSLSNGASHHDPQYPISNLQSLVPTTTSIRGPGAPDCDPARAGV
jgi:hypothetical protein